MTAILLISDQTLPNLLYLKQFGPFERYVFITTDRMEEQGRSAWIAQTYGIREEQIQPEPVTPEHPGSTLERLEALQLGPGRVMVNITGGTKMMALAAYAWALKQPEAQVLYLPIGSEHFLEMHPGNRELKLDVQVSLEEYLNVYGVQVTGKGDWLPWREEAERIFEHLSGSRRDPGIQQMLEYARTAGARGLSAEERQRIQFYASAWLEVFLTSEVQRIYGLPLNQIAQGIRVNKSGPTQPYGNEYDLMFVRENRLYVAECKFFTPSQDGFKRKSIASIRTEVHKLAGVNILLGLFAKPFFCIIQHDGKKVLPFIHDSNRSDWDELGNILRLKQPAEMDTIADPARLEQYLKRL